MGNPEGAIVGYPYGLNDNNLPMWVSGTIASEPEFLYRTEDDDQIPIILVDARTREGQSGSPVLLFRYPGEVVAKQDRSVGIVGATQSKLLGFYTGRIPRDSDLGAVWRIGSSRRSVGPMSDQTSSPSLSRPPHLTPRHQSDDIYPWVVWE